MQGQTVRPSIHLDFPASSPLTRTDTPRSAGLIAHRGLRAGLLGGALGGAVGGGFGESIGQLVIPAADVLLLRILSGTLVGALVGALTGLTVGALAGEKAGRLGTFLAVWSGTTAAAIETANKELVHGLVALVFGVAGVLGLWYAVPRLCALVWQVRILRWLALGWLLVCLAGEVYGRLRPAPPFTPTAARPQEAVVQLRGATIPSPLGFLARHCWFAAFDPESGRWQRWEVWQKKDAGGTSWGHLHKDLMRPDAGVGGGHPQVLREWRGEEARALLAVLNTPEEYSLRDTYVAWPGPCCNTYVAWVLREARVPADLDPLALGKDYLGLAGAGVTPTRTGWQVETSTLGFKAGLRDGLECHFCGLTFGLDVWPPALETPLGRIGFPEGGLDPSSSP